MGDSVTILSHYQGAKTLAGSQRLGASKHPPNPLLARVEIWQIRVKAVEMPNLNNNGDVTASTEEIRM